MAEMPNIQGPDRKKPICYDPEGDRFLTIDEIIAGTGPLVPPDRLTAEQQKRLVVERNRVGSDYTVQNISGPARSRDNVVEQIEADTQFGRQAVAAEIMYLQDLVKQVADAL